MKLQFVPDVKGKKGKKAKIDYLPEGKPVKLEAMPKKA